MGIFDILNMTLEEIQETDRPVFAGILSDEIRASYLSGGKVLSLDYYRYYGRPFRADEWKAAADV